MTKAELLLALMRTSKELKSFLALCGPLLSAEAVEELSEAADYFVASANKAIHEARCE